MPSWIEYCLAAIAMISAFVAVLSKTQDDNGRVQFAGWCLVLLSVATFLTTSGIIWDRQATRRQMAALAYGNVNRTVEDIAQFLADAYGLAGIDRPFYFNDFLEDGAFEAFCQHVPDMKFPVESSPHISENFYTGLQRRIESAVSRLDQIILANENYLDSDRLLRLQALRQDQFLTTLSRFASVKAASLTPSEILQQYQMYDKRMGPRADDSASEELARLPDKRVTQIEENKRQVVQSRRAAVSILIHQRQQFEHCIRLLREVRRDVWAALEVPPPDTRGVQILYPTPWGRSTLWQNLRKEMLRSQP